jgi:hypothetical protein
MRSRYKGSAGRAGALAALGVSGALLVHSVHPQSLNPQNLNPQSPNPQGLNLRPGNYELLTTTDLPPQAAAASSPDMLARLTTRAPPTAISPKTGTANRPKTCSWPASRAIRAAG